MSGDSLSTFGPSDSGFLDAFLPNPTGTNPTSAGPQQSRVGDDPHAIDNHSGGDNPLCSDRPMADGPITDEGDEINGLGSEWVFDSDPPAPTEAEINRLLVAVPLPSDYLARLRRTFKLQ